MDHRQGKRHRSFSLVKVSCNGRNIPGLVYNCSQQGVFLLSTARVQKNQHVEILIEGLGDKTIVHVPGFIVHHGKTGFGLMFCEPDGATREFVNRISNKVDCTTIVYS